MWDDRSVAIWGSYGAAVLAMILALVVARVLLSRARRELRNLQEEQGQ
ncbi:MAG: heme exporter protein CcmD [Alphaproteobacteria bacterium]